MKDTDLSAVYITYDMELRQVMTSLSSSFSSVEERYYLVSKVTLRSKSSQVHKSA